MAEPVRARRLTDQEGQKLQQIVRRGKHESVRVRRALIIMASGLGRRCRPSPAWWRRYWAERFHPELTAADVPAVEMGATAVDFLIERIANPDAPPRHRLLAPPISPRSSPGPVPASG